MVFIGLVGMIDPPRPEVKEAVTTARTAGIRPVMITGDHPLTAQHIAQELTISRQWAKCLDWSAVGRKCRRKIGRQRWNTCLSYARVSPEHKLKIVQALQDQGHIVAMTGDGVNDAPALKKSRYWRGDGHHRHRCFQRSGRHGAAG